MRAAAAAAALEGSSGAIRQTGHHPIALLPPPPSTHLCLPVLHGGAAERIIQLDRLVGRHALQKTAFLSHSYLKTIILPRQARDKHRESTQKDAVFRTFSSCVVSDDATHNQTQRTVSKAVPYILSTARSFDPNKGLTGAKCP
jgi:hypothetical protein